MEENKNPMNQLGEETKRHREMTEERKNKRKRILIRVAVGIGIATGTAAVLARVVLPLIDNYMVVGGAMGQWEEVPMHAETA